MQAASTCAVCKQLLAYHSMQAAAGQHKHNSTKNELRC